MGKKGVERKTDPGLIATIAALKEKGRATGAPLWRDIAERLEKPRRLWAEVNVEHVAGTVNDGEVAVVPGKLLGDGVLTKKISVAAFSASRSAAQKVKATGGQVWGLREFAERAKNARNVRIVG